MCASWNSAKIAASAGQETFVASIEMRKRKGAADSTIFDYCNASSQPNDRDILEALLLNPQACLFTMLFLRLQ
jgi:hypothetical protein